MTASPAAPVAVRTNKGPSVPAGDFGAKAIGQGLMEEAKVVLTLADLVRTVPATKITEHAGCGEGPFVADPEG